MILKRIVSEIGFQVCEAANGRDALNVLDAEKGAVTLVLADWNMPEMNGLEMLKQLRQRPEFSSVKVVMVTTEAELSHMAVALASGANEYVMKPFTKDVVREKLNLIGALPAVSV